MLSVARDALVNEASLLALVYAKVKEMDPMFGPAPRPALEVPQPERREFDPEAYDDAGHFRARWRRPSVRGNRGQGLVEYALILALIAIIAIVALVFVGGNVSDLLNRVGESI